MEPQGITGRVLRNVSMKRYTSMKVGGTVPYLFYPEDEAGLRLAIAWLNETGQSYRFLGNGTNVIVADRGFGGGLIRVSRMRRLRFTMTGTGASVEAGAGLPLKSVIRSCAARGLTGLEKLFGIPGTVGGALKMNAGSFGAAISDCLNSLRYMDESGAVQKRRKDEMKFGYRSSSILDRHCVIEATFGLTHADPSRIQADMDCVWRERLRKHPMERPSAGSVFKNGNGGPCWSYIDRAGLRGAHVGAAAVSDKHPNFIVNMGGATASDVVRLIETVKKRVAEASGVTLEEEVELWGFDDGA
jgi:UDP-N-acetylmuramate dehydrogenase